MQITENLIIECLNKLVLNSSIKQKYKDYYEGNHKNYQMQDSRSNMKLVFNYPRKFMDNRARLHLGCGDEGFPDTWSFD